MKHSAEVKRVAPYLLLFVINLMVSNDRPTTLYSKVIKLAAEDLGLELDLTWVQTIKMEGFYWEEVNRAGS